MVKRKTKIWDILAWISFAIVVIYFLLKILGLIHSPLTLDVITLASAAYFVGRYAKKFDDMFRDVDDIKKDIRVLDKKCPVFKKAGTKTR